jgi:hypothetical protein
VSTQHLCLTIRGLHLDSYDSLGLGPCMRREARLPGRTASMHLSAFGASVNLLAATRLG